MVVVIVRIAMGVVFSMGWFQWRYFTATHYLQNKVDERIAAGDLLGRELQVVE